MVYHLKTAFERDETGFCAADNTSEGTASAAAKPSISYFNRLGQGSGGAPPAWQVVSTLQLGAYKRYGYGM